MNKNKKIISFWDADTWKLAHSLTVELYNLTRKFPKEELYCLTSQLRRAVISIEANIAEGFYRETRKELIRFLYQARGSCGEVADFLIIAKDLNYISKQEAKRLFIKSEDITKKLSAWIRSLRKK